MLQDVVENYISSLSSKEYERGGGSRNTSMAYRNDLNQFCSYLLAQGVTDWSQVSRELVAAYLLQMRDGYAYRPTTIARKLAALKSFFRYLRNEQLLFHDPVEKLETPRIQKDLPQILTPEQVNRLFEQVDARTPAGMRDFAMLHVLYATGMRASELVSLNLNDFNSLCATIICPGRGGQARRVRVLPLSAEALSAIRGYLERARLYLVRGPREQQALFLNHHGERLTRQGFWLIIKGYARQIGVSNITPHVLRHSFAITMLKSGMDLTSVQLLLGHAHISTTQIYSQLVHLDTEKGEEVMLSEEDDSDPFLW
jgi:integrase/recombinase XerD